MRLSWIGWVSAAYSFAAVCFYAFDFLTGEEGLINTVNRTLWIGWLLIPLVILLLIILIVLVVKLIVRKDKALSVWLLFLSSSLSGFLLLIIFVFRVPILQFYNYNYEGLWFILICSLIIGIGIIIYTQRNNPPKFSLALPYIVPLAYFSILMLFTYTFYILTSRIKFDSTTMYALSYIYTSITFTFIGLPLFVVGTLCMIVINKSNDYATASAFRCILGAVFCAAEMGILALSISSPAMPAIRVVFLFFTLAMMVFLIAGVDKKLQGLGKT